MQSDDFKHVNTIDGVFPFWRWGDLCRVRALGQIETKISNLYIYFRETSVDLIFTDTGFTLSLVSKRKGTLILVEQI